MLEILYTTEACAPYVPRGKTKGPRRYNLTGQVFNQLTAIRCAFVDHGGNAHWLFRCECGTEKVITASLVKRGHVQACGCARGESHRDSYSREYAIWRSMLSRCENPKAANYRLYGARGVRVCARWKESYSVFLSDMGRAPKPLSLDRINPNLGYDPSNCRWASISTQSNNKRNSVKLTLMGVTQTCAQWARCFGISRNTLYRVVKQNLPEEEILRRYA